MKVICPYSDSFLSFDPVLCMLYSNFKIDGKSWAHFPSCDKKNCPFLHPELLGNMIWENE